MRHASIRLFVLSIVILGAGRIAAASETVTRHVVVTAQFRTRTSLRVSTRVLHFDVRTPDAPATVAVDFAAGARTSSGGEVVLSVEPLAALNGPGGAADVEASVGFSGVGDGTASGVLSGAEPVVAARWVGSGLREGRLVFALRASESGTYVLPVRLVLSTP